MYSPLRLAGKYFRYYLTAANGKGHGVHSPFVFDFVTHVLNDRRIYAEYAPIEMLRSRLSGDTGVLPIEDLGAGSVSGAGTQRRVLDIVRRSAKPQRLGRLLFRIARHYRPGVMVELGTSLGLSTAYLAAGAGLDRAEGEAGAPGSRLYTIEGSAALAEAAAGNLRSLGLDARIVTGNFDDELAPLLQTIPPVDLAFIDGNHRYEPTMRYFESLFAHASPGAVLIFDDIYWSGEMERAWEDIRRDPRVMLTIDLFFLGFVFIREEFRVKQDFTIRF
ncbi:MAG TPA: class I SAM-dependent methyltransferase [Puia sp.]|nr:class I SAM-dependent methyltransferase [Puia sp.]